MDEEQNTRRFQHPRRHVVQAARPLYGRGWPRPDTSARMKRREVEASRDAPRDALQRPPM